MTEPDLIGVTQFIVDNCHGRRLDMMCGELAGTLVSVLTEAPADIRMDAAQFCCDQIMDAIKETLT